MLKPKDKKASAKVSIWQTLLVILVLFAGGGLVYWESRIFMSHPTEVNAFWGGWIDQAVDSDSAWVAQAGDSQIAESGEVELKETVRGEDARVEIVRRYLEKYKSPLLPYAQRIVELSDSYGFEYYWMVAIGQQESNLCKKIPENSHNCWGYGIHSRGTLRFENYDLALASYSKYLKEQYFDKGLNTPELIMKKYCPHSNGSWARGVSQFIGELKGEDE